MADRLFGITDPGKVRDNNEDVFIAAEVMNGQFIIAAVIDGVGGYAGGEVAAALTEEIILKEFSVISQEISSQLLRAFKQANETIIAEKQGSQELSDMACVATLVVIDKQNNEFHYIHVGDTRLYLFRDNSLIKISHDQSFVGFLEDSGRLTEEAAMTHPKRNQINQALGLDSHAASTAAYFETGSSPFLPNDLILICSDGLTDLVNKQLISSVLSAQATLQVKAEQLIASANAAGGKDNITVVLARNDKTPVLHDISRPVATAVQTTAGNVPERPSKQAAHTDKKNENQKELFGTSAEAVAVSTTAYPISNQQTQTGETPPQADLFNDNQFDRSKYKNNSRLTIILALLCLVFIGTTLVLYFDLLHRKQEARQTTALVPVVNPQEKLLWDILAKLKSDTLTLSASQFKSPVILTKAIHINRDTLIIKADGNVSVQSDSTYKGPALIIGAQSKYVKIEQLVLQNFQTGIISPQHTVDLKNVRFIQVKTPLQLLFEFPDHSFINGRLTRRVYQADTLAKK